MDYLLEFTFIVSVFVAGCLVLMAAFGILMSAGWGVYKLGEYFDDRS